MLTPSDDLVIRARLPQISLQDSGLGFWGMARQLPVAETAVGAVIFGLTNVPMLIRLGWLSVIMALALVCLALFVMTHAYDGLPEFIGGLAGIDWSAFDEDMAQPMADELVGIFTQVPDLAPILVGAGIALAAGAVFLPVFTLLLRVSAGETTAPGGLFYWQWGTRETRTLLTLIGFVVASAVIGAVFAALMAATSGITLSAPAGTGGLIGFVIALALVIANLWINLRLVLVVPAAAMDDDVNFLAAVSATSGNVLRLLGSMLLLGLMSMLIMLATGLGVVILAIFSGLAAASAGAETPMGEAFGMGFGILTVLVMIYASLALKLASLAWWGRAWAALRQG